MGYPWDIPWTWALPGIYDWNSEDVARFLTGLSLDKYLQLFDGVDGATLTELGEDDLKELGCEDLLSRKKLVGHISREKLLVAPPPRSLADWIRRRIRDWIYVYPYPVVITTFMADQSDAYPDLWYVSNTPWPESCQ